MNDFEGIENLSDDEMLKLYDDVIKYSDNFISGTLCYGYCVCRDGRTYVNAEYESGLYWTPNMVYPGLYSNVNMWDFHTMCTLSGQGSLHNGSCRYFENYYSVYFTACDYNYYE